MGDLGNKDIFAKNLKYYIDTSKKDRKQVCKDLNIKYSTFSEWINAKKYPRIDKIELLANYFGILKSDLIEEKNNSFNYKSILAETLRELRKEKNLSAFAVAEAVGVSQRTYFDLEKGLSNPTVNTLILFADFYNVPLDYMLGRSYSNNDAAEHLTPKGKEHLKLFSQLNDDGQNKANDYVTDLLENPKYSNNGITLLNKPIVSSGRKGIKFVAEEENSIPPIIIKRQ